MSDTLMLNSDIYSNVFLDYAIKQYFGIAEISFMVKGKYYICTFKNCKYGIQRTISEFENYMIGLMNSRTAPI